MIVVYAERESYEDHIDTVVLGVTTTVEEAQALCQAYAQQRVRDHTRFTWHLHWIEVSEPLTVEVIPGLIQAATTYPGETRPRGDDTMIKGVVAMDERWLRSQLKGTV